MKTYTKQQIFDLMKEIEESDETDGWNAWCELRNVLDELEVVKQSAHPTGGGLCAICGKSADYHENHDYVAPLTATSG